MKTAIIIGGTGLVGKELVKLLLNDDSYNEVRLFVRRKSGFEHPKLNEYVVDFASTASWSELVKGDVLFSAMGTTLKTAGSKAKQYEVDFTYQYEFAKAAAANGVKDYVLISSIGANAQSSFFYMRIKGELDEAVSKLAFERIAILRPAQLVGKRDEKRSGEEIGLKVIRLLIKMGLLKKRLPIEGKTVAQAMLNAVLADNEKRIYTGNELFRLAEL